MESILTYLTGLDPWAIYLLVAGIAYIENVFPPFPSDVLVVAAASLAAVGQVNGWVLITTTTLGSTLGFMTMYAIGRWIGIHLLESGKVKFLPPDQVRRVEGWFRQYGYGVVVANRFLAGTRAVVSFFAGMSRLPIVPSVGLSFASALVWNFILVQAGLALGSNWERIIIYLDAYGKTVTSVVVVVTLGYIAYRVFGPKSGAKKEGPSA
ncbi:MAG: DedA family protein [Bacteroidetes bacterium]|nr:DedA family protein [Bacteroidota bacterium]